MPYKDPKERNRRARERYAKDPKSSRDRQYKWRDENPGKWSEIQARAAKRREGVPRLFSESRLRDLAEYQRIYRIQHFGKYTCTRLKNKAKDLEIPFNLEPDDIVVPKECPVLGISLSFGGVGQRDDAPSIDRLFPSRGYVKGNVRVISMKANRIKNNATLGELELVLKDLRRLHGNSS